MKNIFTRGIVFILFLAGSFYPAFSQSKENKNLKRAQQTLDNIYACYSEKNTTLLHENYPFDANYTATYLATADTGSQKRFAYLWPFSGTFSGVNAIFRSSKSHKYLDILEKSTLPALQKYYDNSRKPACYASYLAEAGLSDRFYDDNVWLGIDFTELYLQTKNKKHLDKAVEIWQFILSGTDDKLGGGIYWCEQKKHSKNTCSNAPGSVLAFRLFEATGDSTYFHKGLELYNWTRKNLQDPADKLYWDNISLSGNIGKAKFPYNSGQMLQAAALLYKLTGKKEYLTEAQSIAVSCMNYFFRDFTPETGTPFRISKPGNVWFVAVMLRGFTELYRLDKNKDHLEIFNTNLDYAWNHVRDEHGFFRDNWSEPSGKKNQWLLDQAAMVEMYASISLIFK